MSINTDNFFERVYEVVKQIPYGRVTNYGSIAKYLGSAKGSRAVGYAMNKSHNTADIPAHRVVNKIGLLTGKHHFFGSNLMKDLLKSEGIEIVDNQVKMFDSLYWDPCNEL
ncbi:MGMT family protein [Flavobacteriaceae bacterium]|nr:MGMT family protein [Flavobacteriaceae bacterium]MDC1492025.1 MGMT family protein [Flavobacteriaceae bacterium]